MTKPNLNEDQPEIATGMDTQIQATTTSISERWTELISAVLLAVVAIATAWNGFQSAQWGGVQSIKFG
ncbi:MAG: hypothetical protein GTO18_10420 [Anaerolineales bacterium]|nr:hypothetical protein [Anaerolineales bacterium]